MAKTNTMDQAAEYTVDGVTWACGVTDYLGISGNNHSLRYGDADFYISMSVSDGILKLNAGGNTYNLNSSNYLEGFRDQLSQLAGCSPSEITFTSVSILGEDKRIYSAEGDLIEVMQGITGTARTLTPGSVVDSVSLPASYGIVPMSSLRINYTYPVGSSGTYLEKGSHTINFSGFPDKSILTVKDIAQALINAGFEDISIEGLPDETPSITCEQISGHAGECITTTSVLVDYEAGVTEIETTLIPLESGGYVTKEYVDDRDQYFFNVNHKDIQNTKEGISDIIELYGQQMNTIADLEAKVDHLQENFDRTFKELIRLQDLIR